MTRIFLTRTLETATSSQRGSSIQTTLAAEIAAQATAAKDLRVTVASAQATGDKLALDEATRLLDEQQKRLQLLVQELSSTAAASTSRSRQVTVSQTLQRPVAIGFRGVRTTLFPDE